MKPVLEGPLQLVLSQLFKHVVKVNIIIPANAFKTKDGHDGISCSVKASDGYLYPLKNSMIWIHKPVIYIKLSEIKYVEFHRVDMNARANWRSFDMVINKIKDDSSITFASIDKDEYNLITQYLNGKSIKIRIIDPNTHQQVEMASQEDEEEKAGRGGTASRRRAMPATTMQELPDDYDSDEDDESFKSGGSAAGNDDEDSEASNSSENESMDEDVNDEVKQLQKELKKEGGDNLGRG